MTKYKIWCEVSGGVTGSRAAWLKSNGNEVVYDIREHADTEALRLNKRTNDNPFRTVNFRYSVVETRHA